MDSRSAGTRPRRKRTGNRRALPGFILLIVAAGVVILGTSAFALASKPKGGEYKGHTSQGKKRGFEFKLNKAGSRVNRLDVELKVHCNRKSEAGTETWYLGAPGIAVTRIKHGRFYYHDRSGLVIKGHFSSATVARGTVRLHQKYSKPNGDHVVCDTGKRTWKATHYG